ncbi:hypothetical protein GCM10010321_82760 [Streptomyces chartreusis]|nr:hypothetical protein GCM10010321_82760 [Streptomyces chartreusis]
MGQRRTGRGGAADGRPGRTAKSARARMPHSGIMAGMTATSRPDPAWLAIASYEFEKGSRHPLAAVRA